MSWLEIVEAAEAVRVAAVAAEPSLVDLPLAGIGWATVDAERAQEELDVRLGSAHRPGAAWRSIPRDTALGARAWLRTAGAPRSAQTGPPSRTGGPSLVLLEPDTEGRIAASLARFGEGVAVIYLGAGPAGAGRLLRGGGPGGPHVVLVGEGGGGP